MSGTPLSARVMGRIRRMAPDRVVERDVQGVHLRMPWSHRLPDYVRTFPEYGQNLVALARELAVAEPGLCVVDVGANIGDSAVQILAAVPDAHVVCVEGDDYWLRFLRMNVGADPRVSVIPALVVARTDEEPASAEAGTSGSDGLVAVRAHGTTRFVTGEAGAMEQLSGSDLRERLADRNVRLVKSDTDGFDTRIVPAIAGAFPDTRPVLFMEYDPRLTRLAGDDDPAAVWDRLRALGYVDALVWGNTGELIAAMGIDAAAARSHDLEHLADGDSAYWDVALAHEQDANGRAVLARLADAG